MHHAAELMCADVKEGMALRGNIRYAIERARQEDLFELVRLGLVPSAEVQHTQLTYTNHTTHARGAHATGYTTQHQPQPLKTA